MDTLETSQWLSRSARRARLHSALALLACCLLSSLTQTQPFAARISEPNTVLYGQIAERVGERQFLITRGRLVWNLRTTGPGGRDYQLATQLEPLANGRFSYRLSIPHEVLAYDLTVNPQTIGLASTASRVQHLSVTLDGKALTVVPAAVDGFTLQQASRAGALRVDLSPSSNSPDSDRDGLPDWWEDQNGLDKFNPNDGPGNNGIQTEAAHDANSNVSAAAQARTFAEWRSIWFPGDATDLNAFGQQDPDQDGVPNLLEYAFDLDPTRADAHLAGALPHAVSTPSWTGIAFRQHANPADLTYSIEVSDDLLHWEDGAQEVYAVGPRAEEGGEAAYASRSGLENSGHRFFRVRVQRR